MLKKFPSDKANVSKKCTFFLLGAPTHHSFTFNSQFLYKLKYKFQASKTLCGIFRIRFHLVFIKVYIFVQLGLFDFKAS